MKAALFWDIDGTLLTTGRAGIFAWEEAAREVTGVQPDFSTLVTAGLTDLEVAAKIAEACGAGGAAPGAGARMVRLYEERLPAALPRREGRVLPNVREILERLRGRPDVASFLLTGNTRAGARAKLRHYGLDGYFAGGAFADPHVDRASIARAALELTRQVAPEVALERVFVIGDTPHDIRCGQAIGARPVAVATGVYSVEELRACEPWRTLPELPPPEAFLGELGIDGAA